MWETRELTLECKQLIHHSFNSSLLSSLCISYLKAFLKQLALSLQKDVAPAFKELYYAITNIFKTKPVVFKKVYNTTCVSHLYVFIYGILFFFFQIKCIVKIRYENILKWMSKYKICFCVNLYMYS